MSHERIEKVVKTQVALKWCGAEMIEVAGRMAATHVMDQRTARIMMPIWLREARKAMSEMQAALATVEDEFREKAEPDAA